MGQGPRRPQAEPSAGINPGLRYRSAMQLRRIQIEARARQAVEVVQAGGRVEDDLIECKADWPDESKVRQLAAHANAARGDPIIWLIGVDENSHQVTKPRDVDPADWWAVMSKRFDEVFPELLHVTLHIDEGKTIVALAFTTDQAPYVITTGAEEGRVEREVPIRVATATRTARRHDLIRMLAPMVTIPQASPVRLHARIIAFDEHETYPLMLEATVFVEHSGGGAVLLPAHRMWARVESDTRHFPFDLPPIDMSISHTGETTSEPFGIQQNRDGFLVLGSGSLDVLGQGRIRAEDIHLLRQVASLQVRLSFGVAGTDRRIEVLATLYRTAPAAAQQVRWDFHESTVNPWSEPPAT